MTTPVDVRDLRNGDLVSVKYQDHSLLRNVEPANAGPIIREAVGRVERVDPVYLFIVVDEYLEPGPAGLPVRRATGFVILRATIISVKRLPVEEEEAHA